VSAIPQYGGRCERQETLRKQVMKIASEGKVEFDPVYEKVVHARAAAHHHAA